MEAAVQIGAGSDEITRESILEIHRALAIELVLGANKDAYIAGLESFRDDRLDDWTAQFARAVEMRHRTRRRGDSWEAKELLALLDELEHAVKMPG